MLLKRLATLIAAIALIAVSCAPKAEDTPPPQTEQAPPPPPAPAMNTAVMAGQGIGDVKLGPLDAATAAAKQIAGGAEAQADQMGADSIGVRAWQWDEGGTMRKLALYYKGADVFQVMTTSPKFATADSLAIGAGTMAADFQQKLQGTEVMKAPQDTACTFYCQKAQGIALMTMGAEQGLFVHLPGSDLNMTMPTFPAAAPMAADTTGATKP